MLAENLFGTGYCLNFLKNKGTKFVLAPRIHAARTTPIPCSKPGSLATEAATNEVSPIANFNLAVLLRILIG